MLKVILGKSMGAKLEQAELLVAPPTHVLQIVLCFSAISTLLVAIDAKCKDCSAPRKCCKDTCYDPVYASCCNTVVSPKVTADGLCCGHESYNAARDLCCRNDVIVAKCGLKARCCGEVCQNPDVHLCCQDVVTPKCAGTFSACCGDECYDSRTHKCQVKRIVPK